MPARWRREKILTMKRDEIRDEVVEVLVEHPRRFPEFLEPRLGSRAAAEELLQAVFVKGLRAARSGMARASWPGFTGRSAAL